MNILNINHRTSFTETITNETVITWLYFDYELFNNVWTNIVYDSNCKQMLHFSKTKKIIKFVGLSVIFSPKNWMTTTFMTDKKQHNNQTQSIIVSLWHTVTPGALSPLVWRCNQKRTVTRDVVQMFTAAKTEMWERNCNHEMLLQSLVCLQLTPGPPLPTPSNRGSRVIVESSNLPGSVPLVVKNCLSFTATWTTRISSDKFEVIIFWAQPSY